MYPPPTRAPGSDELEPQCVKYPVPPYIPMFGVEECMCDCCVMLLCHAGPWGSQENKNYS